MRLTAAVSLLKKKRKKAHLRMTTLAHANIYLLQNTSWLLMCQL